MEGQLFLPFFFFIEYNIYMKKILLILCLLPLPSYTRLYINFSKLSYSEVLYKIKDTSLSNTIFIIHHPYNQKLGLSLKVSNTFINHFEQELTHLQQQTALQKNKLYLLINPFSILNDTIYIPDLTDRKEQKKLKEKLLALSQFKQFGLIIDMKDISNNSKKKIEKFINKIIPQSIFINGITTTITNYYYQQLILSSPALYPNIIEKNNIIHDISSMHTGQNLSILFYLLSQKSDILVDYSLLNYQYALNLVYIALFNNKFKMQTYNNQLIIYNKDYFSILSQNKEFQIQKIPNKYISQFSDTYIKNIIGASPLKMDKEYLEFLIWPNSILIWNIKR